MVTRVLLQVLIAILSGGTPVAWMWGCFAPALLDHTTSPAQIWCAAMLCYIVHGTLIELLPFEPLQPNKQLRLATVLPRVAVNLASCAVFTMVTRPSHTVSDGDAAYYLIVAALGNEITYAPIHRLLHTKALYKYHHLHHLQRAPRAFGAVYCTMVEMWCANLVSFLLPLSLTNAPLQVYFVWIVSGIQTTQIHHSSKQLPWPWSLSHQPKFHDDHHRYVSRNFGNLGILERVLKKE